jgi:alginate O-acetyltransferase complex protein AlgI
MLFTQIEFLVLFTGVLLFVLFCHHNTARKWVMLAASYYFYAYWDWRFLGLLLTSTAVDFLIGLGLGFLVRPRARKWLLIGSLVVNLGILGFFKYANFFIESLRGALGPLGWDLRTLDVILPVGISFYTFQTLSYTIDVYRRRLEPCRSLLDFALFVAFFPQLVAGPIVRAADFLPQLKTPRGPTWPRFYDGFRQFTVGLFKKLVIADNLAGFVDQVFLNAGAYDALTSWLAVIAYSIQIYCDFSGYSDMAIGLARVLGYDLAKNFDWPYLATRIDEFWRRWHISLSTWLRDYLYIPLGGNRKGRARTYANLMLTMALGGLWHGAAWTFVVWGIIHGVALSMNRFLSELNPDRDRSSTDVWSRCAGWLVTSMTVMIAWVFFRAPTFDVAIRMLGAMFGVHQGFSYLPVMTGVLLPIVIGAHAIKALGHNEFFWLPANRVRSAAVLLTMIWVVVVFHPRDFQPFIYFQF